jgi:hypothetical protein
MGYGLIPGAGLASAEDMLRSSGTSGVERGSPRHAALMTANQRNKLIEMYRERHGGSEVDALQGLDAVFQSTYKHPMSAGLVDEASKVISQFIAQKAERAKKQ